MSLYAIDTDGKTNSIHLVNGAVKIYGEPIEFYQMTKLIGTLSTAIVLPNARSLTILADGTTVNAQYHLKHDPDYAGQTQILSNTLVGTFVTPGTYVITVGGDTFNSGTEVEVDAIIAGKQQMIQCTCPTGTVDGSGIMEFKFTSAILNNGTTATINISLAAGATTSTVVGSWVTALPAVLGTNFILTRLGAPNTHILQIKTNSYLANDSTMAATWDAKAVGGYTLISGTLLGTASNGSVGTALSTRAQAALIIGTALGAESDVTDFFAVSYGTDSNGTQAVVKLTCGTVAANDTTLFFSYLGTEATGPADSTSTITRVGIAANDQVWFNLADSTTLEVKPPYLTATPFGTIWLKGTEAGLAYITCWGDVGATVTNESLT